jgi:hypothetical protein
MRAKLKHSCGGDGKKSHSLWGGGGIFYNSSTDLINLENAARVQSLKWILSRPNVQTSRSNEVILPEHKTLLFQVQIMTLLKIKQKLLSSPVAKNLIQK